MIPFLDQDNDTVHLSKEQVAEYIKAMRNPPGWYILVPYTEDMQKVGGNTVVQILAKEMPKYSIFALRRKRIAWDKAQRKVVSKVRQNNPKNLDIVQKPFVLKMPWLRLKRNEAHAICVE